MNQGQGDKMLVPRILALPYALLTLLRVKVINSITFCLSFKFDVKILLIKGILERKGTLCDEVFKKVLL